jgi:hypothetical protein
MPRGYPNPPTALASPDSNYQARLIKSEDGTQEVVLIFSITDLMKPLRVSKRKEIVVEWYFTPDSRLFTVVREGNIFENYDLSSSRSVVLRSPSEDSISEDT